MKKQGFNLSELDFNNAGSWPQSAKIGACVIVASLIVFFAWWLMVKDQQDLLTVHEAEEQILRKTYEEEAAKAANLEPLKQQLAQMEQMLQQMLRQLPSKTEMPDLIVDISQTAVASGISNELFQPGAELRKDFYVEQPISLRMSGTYHQFGAFVSGVASLPRVVIMTMHDIALKPKDDKSSVLEMQGTIKTYRYLDETELAESAVPAPAGVRK